MGILRRFKSLKKPGGIINAANPKARKSATKMNKNARTKTSQKKAFGHVVAKEYRTEAKVRASVEKRFRALKARKSLKSRTTRIHKRASERQEYSR
jgi:hypothetical protein